MIPSELETPRKSTKTMAAQEQYVVDIKGKKTAVILSLKQYQKLLEDLHDLAIVAERRTEQPISLEEMKLRLKKDGVL
jgi:PHD/YefM family antitoxin component YafN of YafNO toxin-antitoxin module